MFCLSYVLRDSCFFLSSYLEVLFFMSYDLTGYRVGFGFTDPVSCVFSHVRVRNRLYVGRWVGDVISMLFAWCV